MWVKNSRGYTIIEVLIFLAVSMLLMSLVAGAMGGQEEDTRFRQSVRAFEQDLQDIYNDVSTGYYATVNPANNGFTCQQIGDGSEIDINPGGTVEQGSNAGCVFLGKILRFELTTDRYTAYTLVNSSTARSIADIKARMLGTAAAKNQGLTEAKQTSSGLTFRKVISTTDGSRTVAGLGVISQFNSIDTVTGLNSGSAARVNVLEYTGGYAGAEVRAADLSPINSPTLLCLEQSDTGRTASVEINNTGVQTANTKIKDWDSRCN